MGTVSIFSALCRNPIDFASWVVLRLLPGSPASSILSLSGRHTVEFCLSSSELVGGAGNCLEQPATQPALLLLWSSLLSSSINTLNNFRPSGDSRRICWSPPATEAPVDKRRLECEGLPGEWEILYPGTRWLMLIRCVTIAWVWTVKVGGQHWTQALR